MAAQPQAAIPTPALPEPPRASTSALEPRIPAFPSGTSQLPTPQSPANNIGQYLQGPESPLSQISGRPVYAAVPLQRPMVMPQPPLTPESSPYTPRHDPSRYPMTHALPNFNPYAHYLTPKASASAPPTVVRTLPPRMATPPPLPSHPANLSSPFNSMRPPTYFLPPRMNPGHIIPVHVDDIFTSSGPPSSSAQTSTPPMSPPPPAPAGGEMERIRQTMLQNQMAQQQEAEARRPEYLKRGKRPLSETGPSSTTEEENARRPGVGITDSPNKGRRITLFQETSDESFEESLMAGGYGRYRTADWLGTQSPSSPATPAPPSASDVVKRVEALQATQPPSEKSKKLRRRLDAFRSDETTNTSTEPRAPKVFPVLVAGMGRMLLDAESEEREKKGPSGGKKPPPPATTPSPKKRQEPSARERRAELMALAMEEAADKPNWPDTEFPWILRLTERQKLVEEEESHRMKRIEAFLDRDTDDEDSDAEKATAEGEELLTAAEWGQVYREQTRSAPARGGRGKMVPLAADVSSDSHSRGARRNVFIPSDPGDARAALLAKRTVRAISFRKDRRQEEEEEAVLCICKGKYASDDGDVVQCDQCRTWYHLHCLRIPNVAALGPEDEEWYCKACVVVDRSDSSDEEEEVAQPTFAPTADTTDDPWNVLQTPPRLTTTGSKLAAIFGEESRDAPVTPKGPTTPLHLRPTRLWSTGGDVPTTPLGLTPGFAMFDFGYGEDAPFDPTSTPSRGIKFGAAFTTPKTTVSVSPSRKRKTQTLAFGAPGTLDETLKGDEEPRLRLATPSEREGFWTRHLRRLSAEGGGGWASP
ncbi:PHD-type domain-containing protein [Mycena kentingensis (nom. inval.)]|nr:PHD-type domain-containing protein [Mycena kentingensis (nom. inval.)]